MSEARRYPLYLDDLNEIVELLVETVCSTRKPPAFSGMRAFLSRNCQAPAFEAGQLCTSSLSWTVCKQNTTQVRNIKQYLLAVLFNAPTTMNNHYTSLVNHDMHAGGW